MINLIPIEKKKKIIVNFYYKFAAVVFFMIGFSVLVATFAILLLIVYFATIPLSIPKFSEKLFFYLFT